MAEKNEEREQTTTAIPESAKEVELRAFYALDDPYAGHVEGGEEFTTTETQAKFYTKSNWAGPAGTDAREVQLQVAAEEFEERAQARRHSRAARALIRNLLPNSAARGNTAAVGVVPVVLGEIDEDEGEELRTNQQSSSKLVRESENLPSAGDPDAQKAQDDAESKGKTSRVGKDKSES